MALGKKNTDRELMDSLRTFPFPRVNGLAPVWTGKEFLLGKETQKSLCYGQAQSGWSESLTQLHEKEAAGGTHPIDALSRYHTLNSLRPVLENNGTVLDVGCSSGFFLRDIQESYPNVNLIGADFLATIVNRCARKYNGIPMLQFDLRTCPLPDNCLDAVVALNVLEHIDNDEKALSNIYRILKPGGISHIEVPVGPHLYDFYDQMLMHHRRYKKTELIEKCQKAGFSLLKDVSIGWTLYPAFYAAKKINRLAGNKMSAVSKKIRVSAAIQKTRTSAILRFLLGCEKSLGSRLSFMPGVRHFVLLRKP